MNTKTARAARCLLPLMFLLLHSDFTYAQKLPVGFGYADEDRDGKVSQAEMKSYLNARLTEQGLPHAMIFDALDTDNDKHLSESEFDKRHEVLQEILGEGVVAPIDPGKDFVPFAGLDRPIDDSKIMGALFHRYNEQLAEDAVWREAGWKPMELNELPQAVSFSAPKWQRGKPTLDQIYRATLVLCGGGSTDELFTGGAVIISPDGLALTNYHVASEYNGKLIGLLSDGRLVRVTKVLAGDLAADTALVQLDQKGLPYVPIAAKPPSAAEDIVAIHHTESRYYTYDRGYVKRYPLIRGKPWMEISAEYAPGGSGCGIFNSDHELVGLVSMIMVGDGPSIAEQDLTAPISDPEAGDPNSEDSNSESSTDLEVEMLDAEAGSLVVKLAVPLQAIQALLGK